MSIDFKKYQPKSFLKERGKSLETNLAEKVDSEIERLNLITDNSIGIGSSTNFDFEELLKRFWENCDSLNQLEAAFKTKRERKYLLMALNMPFNKKTILGHYPHFVHLLKLYPFEDSELDLQRVAFTFLNFWRSIMESKSAKAAFSKYLNNALKVNDFSLKKTKNLFQSKKYLTEPNNVKLFLQDKVKKGKTLEEGLRECSFYPGNTEFKNELGYELLKGFYKRGELEQFLGRYKEILNFGGMDKRVIPLLVLIADDSKNERVKDLAKEEAFKTIGDPGNEQHWWSPDSFSKYEAENLSNARKMLNSWILESFVEVFFEKLIDDPRRKEFWMGKLDLITSVKVYGSSTAKLWLKNDKRIGDYVEDRFVLTRKRSGSTSGIVMELGKYQIVEFTDKGALYCYLKTSNKISEYVESIQELKNPDMQFACKNSVDAGYLSINDKGKIYHSGNWEDRINVWMKRFIND